MIRKLQKNGIAFNVLPRKKLGVLQIQPPRSGREPHRARLPAARARDPAQEVSVGRKADRLRSTPAAGRIAGRGPAGTGNTGPGNTSGDLIHAHRLGTRRLQHERASPRRGRSLDHGLQRGPRRYRAALPRYHRRGGRASPVHHRPRVGGAPGRARPARRERAHSRRTAAQRARDPRLSRPSARAPRGIARHESDRGARAGAAPGRLRGDPARHHRRRWRTGVHDVPGERVPGGRAGRRGSGAWRAPPPPAVVGANGGAEPLAELPVPVPANLAHVYSECARIWNPIHTDVEVARAHGAARHHPGTAVRRSRSRCRASSTTRQGETRARSGASAACSGEWC